VVLNDHPPSCETAAIVPATQQARIGDLPLHVREGYLRLSDAVGEGGNQPT
jgi:hypothetical protein